ncbi:MAG TPA: hypothetical protein VI434_03370 [Candidatus Dormibacteraeota bacterium]
MLIMLALSAIAAVEFLEIQQVLRLLPGAAMLMAAPMLDDLSARRPRAALSLRQGREVFW